MSNQESIPVPRSRVFVLEDGQFAVQWEENRIQELLSGRYQSFSKDDYGTAITDYELSQLKQAGVVDTYNHDLVYLCPLPSLMPEVANRAYYLNTTLPEVQQAEVMATLRQLELADRFTLRLRQGFVVIWNKDGASFAKFDDAERNRELLISKAPDVFQSTVISFVEVIPLQ